MDLLIMIRTLLVLLLIALTAEVQSASPKVTGIFSNMRFGTEDVYGVEIFITYSSKGYFAQVQCAEGAINRPVVVPAIVAGSSVEFLVPTISATDTYSCPPGNSKGRSPRPE
jgi:hypothetical protein